LVVPSLYYGGGQRVVVSLANELVRRPDVSVTVLVSYAGQHPDMAESLSRLVRVERLPRPLGLAAASVFTYARHFHRGPYDVIHTHLSSCYYCSLAMVWRRGGWVHTVHSLPALEDARPWNRVVKSLLYGRRVKPIVLTERLRANFRELYGSGRGEAVIPNGVPAAPVTTGVRAAEEELRRCRRTERTRILVSLSWLRAVKGFGVMLEAYRRLRGSGADAVLVHLGDAGDWGGAAERAALAAEGVFLLGPRQQVSAYLAQSDFFLLSSTIEGLPMSLLEAMAVGAVPVCTPAGGVPDVIADGLTGFLAEGFTAEQFSAALERAWSLPLAECRAMADRCRRLIADAFSAERMAERYWACYGAVRSERA
jgi:glycosyltransferase involved in cell wall biosynthesis